MKWVMRLALIGLVGLLGVMAPSVTVPGVSSNEIVARADVINSGTIGKTDTEEGINWTLEDNGTLTLTGGTIDLKDFKSNKGIILTYLTDQTSQSGPTHMDYNDFQELITAVKLTGKVTVKSAAYHLFAYLTNVTKYEGLDYLDVSSVSDASSKGTLATGMAYMFAYNEQLKSLTVPALSAEGTHEMLGMFSNNTNLRYLDLSHLDVTNASDFNQMVQGDTNLRVLNLGDWQTTVQQGGTIQFFKGTNELRQLTLSPALVLNSSSGSFGNSALKAPAQTEDYTGNWQAVETGRVDFVDNDPLADYHNYNPLGKTYTNDEIYGLYDGKGHAPAGNVTYVWEPTEAYRAAHIFPDPEPDPQPQPNTPTPTPAPEVTTEADQDDFTSFKVNALRKIHLYSTPTFTTGRRMATYVRKSQMKQPIFQVLEVVTTKAGYQRYRVRDVNRQAKTFGQTGYITANPKFVTRAYYQAALPEITVINPGGVNGYQRPNFNQPLRHYRQGTRLKVKRLVTVGAVTRFMLSDGTYVTANKQFVAAKTVKVPTQVRAKTALNRYDTVNLTRKNRHYTRKSQSVFKVLGWDYSRGNNLMTSGTLRYRVAGGYITANNKYVVAVK